MASQIGMTDTSGVTAPASLYVGEPFQHFDSPEKITRAEQIVTNTVLNSLDEYRELRLRFDEYFKHFANLQPDLPTKTGTRLPTGHGSEICETYRAEYHSLMHSQGSFCPLRPRNYPEDVDSARAKELMIQYQFEFNDYKLKVDDINTSVIVYGIGPAKVFWMQTMVKKPLISNGRPLLNPDGTVAFEWVLAYRGPGFEPVFVYDAYPHPYKRFIDDNYPIATVFYRSYDHFEKMSRGSHPIYFPDQVAKIEAKIPANLSPLTNNRNYQQEQRAALGHSDDNRTTPDGVLTIEWEGRFRFKENDDPTPAIITMANGVIVRCEPSPFLNEENSMIWAVMDRIPGQMYGQGVIAKNLPQIHGANVALNLALTNTARSVKGFSMIRTEWLQNPGDLRNPPNGFIAIKPGVMPMEQIIYESQKPSIGQACQIMLNYFHQRVARLSKSPDIKSGNLMPGENTATEVAGALEELAKGFERPLSMLEETMIKPLTRKFDHLDQQFLDPEMIRVVLDKNAANYPRNIPLGYLYIDADYVPVASLRARQQKVKMGQLGTMLKTITPMIPMQPQKYSLIADILILGMFEELNQQNLDQIKRVMMMFGPAQPQPEGGGGAGRGAPGLPNQRRSNRLPQQNTPQQVANARGGELSNVGR